MGIRYWARPLPAHLVDVARSNPRLLHIDDDYDDYLWELHENDTEERAAWGSRKHALDLDKTFTDFQMLWHCEPPDRRPALELVQGRVTDTHRGWKPHFGVIEPERVSAVRDDIRATRPEDIAAHIEAGRGRFRDEPEPYVRDLTARLTEMLTFLDARLERGEGVLYTIG